MKNSCQICNNSLNNTTHVAREMMFGLRDEFTYLECGSCGCLQNISVPDDLSKYYGGDYYSVASDVPQHRPIYDRIKKIRTRAYLTKKGIIGNILLKNFGIPGLPSWVVRAGMRQESRILEVGCGTGSLLLSLRSEGFRNLTGVDPFIESDIDHGGGLRIIKSYIQEISGNYDFIVLEHAFEHISRPYETMEALRSLLDSNGTLIVSIPLASYAWKHYGVNWVQLDAPRHLFLYTEEGFRILTKQMTIAEIIYDSSAVQFWGSEQYVRDIPLLDDRSYRLNPANSIFSSDAIVEFEDRAITLNEQRMGDQATFYLKK